MALTDEQIIARREAAAPVLRALAFASGEVATLDREMRERAAELPALGAATAETLAAEHEIMARRYRRLANVLRRGY